MSKTSISASALIENVRQFPHDSDCARHNMPAYTTGECDCSRSLAVALADRLASISDLVRLADRGVVPDTHVLSRLRSILAGKTNG